MQSPLEQFEQAVRELTEWATVEGVRLPLAPAVIAQYEADGHVVDLTTGAIALRQDGVRVRATLAGQAVAGEGSGL